MASFMSCSLRDLWTRPGEPRLQLLPSGAESHEEADERPDMRRRRWRLATVLLALSALAARTAVILSTQSARSVAHVSSSTQLDKVKNHTARKPAGHQAASITMLQFNPHWECFHGGNMEKCGRKVFGFLTHLLQNHSTDFANIIELPQSYRPPKGWQMACRKGGGGDTACVLWRSLAWEVVDPHTECWWGHGRACNVMTFQHVRHSHLKVTVLGAHFPHGAGSGQYFDFAGTVRWNMGKTKNATDKVIVLADTNANLHEKSDVGLLEDLSALPAHMRVPTLWYDYRTCCYNNGFQVFFDRVAVNFGKKLELLRDKEYCNLTGSFKHAPPFAQINFPNSAARGAFHHPVLARLTL